MKRFGAILSSLVLVLIYTHMSLAADSNSLTVSANVVGTCKFSSATSTLDFGNLDPSVGGNVNAAGSTQFWCTKGATESFTVGQGNNWSGSSRQMLGPAPGDLIPYSLTVTPDGNPNTGPSTPRTLSISGTVQSADYTGATAGAYQDIVQIDVLP